MVWYIGKKYHAYYSIPSPNIPFNTILWFKWYGMILYGMVWYGIVRYGMVWYGTVWYGTVWYGMVW